MILCLCGQECPLVLTGYNETEVEDDEYTIQQWAKPEEEDEQSLMLQVC